MRTICAILTACISLTFFTCGCSMVQSAWSPDSTSLVFPVHSTSGGGDEIETSTLALYDIKTHSTKILIPQFQAKDNYLLPWFTEDGKTILLVEANTNSSPDSDSAAKGKLIDTTTGNTMKTFDLLGPAMNSGLMHNGYFLYECSMAFSNEENSDPDKFPLLGIRMLNLKDQSEQILFDNQIIFHILKMGNDIGFAGVIPYDQKMLQKAFDSKSDELIKNEMNNYMDKMYSSLQFGKIDPDKKTQVLFAKIAAQDLGGKCISPLFKTADSTQNRIALLLNVLPVKYSQMDEDIDDGDSEDKPRKEVVKQFKKLVVVQDDGKILYKNAIPSSWLYPTPIQLSKEGNTAYIIDIDIETRELLVIEYDYLQKKTRRIPILKPIVIPGEEFFDAGGEEAAIIRFDLKISPDGKTLAFTTLPWLKATDTGYGKLGYDYKNKSYLDNAPLYLIDLTSPERTVTAVSISDIEKQNEKIAPQDH